MTRPLRMIVADNDSMVRGILRHILTGMGLELTFASDGDEAIALAETIDADVVLLDYRMPKRDGLDVCRMLRTLPGYQSIPIVILTAFDDERTRREAKRAGATEFITKPFTISELTSGLKPLLSRTTRSRQLSAPSAALVQP